MTSEQEIRTNTSENYYENVALSLTSSISSSPVISNSSSAASSSSTLPVDNTEAIQQGDYENNEESDGQKLKPEDDMTSVIKKKPLCLTESNNNDTVTALVNSGVGVSLLSKPVKSVEGIKFIPIADAEFIRKICFVWKKENLSKALSNFLSV